MCVFNLAGKTVFYALVHVFLYVCVILHDIPTSFNINLCIHVLCVKSLFYRGP